MTLELLHTLTSIIRELITNTYEKNGGYKSMKKKLKITGIVLLIAVTALSLSIYLIFRTEFKSLNTLKQIEQTDAYTMTYDGDYGLDGLMKKGVSSDKDVVDYVSKHFLHGVPIEFELPDFGCTAFTSTTPDGNHFTARNFDFDDTPIMILNTKPTNGYQSISTIDLDYLGFSAGRMPHQVKLLDKAVLLASIFAPVDGMNEKGLSVSVLKLTDKQTQQETGKPGITTTTAVRMLLDKTATVDEAVALLEQYDMHASANSIFHFLVSDASGKSVVIEYVDNKMVVVDTNKVTNFYVAPGTEEKNKKQNGFDRYDIVEKAQKESKNKMNHKDAMTVLSDARSSMAKDDTDTQWSVIYDQKNKVAKYSFKTDYDHLYDFKVK